MQMIYPQLLHAPDPRNRVLNPTLKSRGLSDLIAGAFWLLDRVPALGKWIDRVKPLRLVVNRLLINNLASAPLSRPLPGSLWNEEQSDVTLEKTKRRETKSSFPTWPGLVEPSLTSRHLPPAEPWQLDGLPSEDAVRDLFVRGSFKTSNTSVLFCFFAQWFTDSFLRTHPKDRRRNTSNHEIDLCQIYGLGEESTSMLRDGGFLKSRHTALGELPPLLALQGGSTAPEFASIAYDPVWAKTFTDHDPPHGIAQNLRADLRRAIGDWPVTDERWKYHYVGGVERGNSTIVYSAISTVFLREHNRLARNLKARYPHFSPQEIFETARNINIIKLIKVIVEDYINHLASSPLKIRVEQGWADKFEWYRSNRITLEFNLLYRWHAMVPSQFEFDGRALKNKEFRFNNTLVEQHGIEAIIDAAARQPAGHLSLHNTPDFLLQAEQNALLFARKFRLMPFNRYKIHWGQRPYASFEELTGGDETLAGELRRLYPDRGGMRGIDRVEFTVGLYAEQRGATSNLPPLLRAMVASDAFTQALTNPLLGKNVFGPEVMTEYGLEEIEKTSTFADIVGKNLADGASMPRCGFTLNT